MMNKITSLVCIFTFIVATTVSTRPALADDVPPSENASPIMFEAVSPLSKGDRAPFEGILISKALAARIEAERKTMISLKLSEAKLNAAVLITKSDLQLKLDIETSKYVLLDEKHIRLMTIKDEQIDFLRESYMPTPWYESPAFMITVGVLAGIGLSIGSAHIVKTVR